MPIHIPGNYTTEQAYCNTITTMSDMYCHFRAALEWGIQESRFEMHSAVQASVCQIMSPAESFSCQGGNKSVDPQSNIIHAAY
jgi:hypothetical protein